MAPRRVVLITIALVLGWVAVCVSVVGDQLLDFVFVVAAARRTEPFSIGVIGFLIGVPVLLGGWVGSWIDSRQDRIHLILIGSVVASAAVTTVLWMCWATSFVAPATYAATFLLGFFGLVTTTVWQSSIPELAAADDDDSVKRVIGWTVTSLTLGAAIGPLVAAGLAPILGRRLLILADALSFAIAAAVFIPAAMRLRARTPRSDIGPSRERPKRVSWLQGIRLILSRPLLRGPALSLSLMNFITFGTSFAIPLMIVRRGFPDRMVALVSASFVVGGLVGSVIATRFRNERMFLLYLVCEPACRAVGLLIVALSNAPAGILIGVALFTVPQGMGRVARLGYMATSFRAGERAKVFGAYQMLIRGLMPLAPLVMEFVVRTMGTTSFFLTAAAILAGLTLALANDRGLRQASVARSVTKGV